MATTINKKEIKGDSELRIKAALFDQLVEVIEDAVLGGLMVETEKEDRISLGRAKKQLAR